MSFQSRCNLISETVSKRRAIAKSYIEYMDRMDHMTLTITNDTDSHFCITLENDIFDPETGRVAVANQSGTTVCTFDLSAGTAIEIVLASDFSALNCKIFTDTTFGCAAGYSFTFLAVRTIGYSGSAVWKIGIDCVLCERDG